MPLLVAFVILPMVEIALFILVGGWLGVWATLGLVVLAGLAGVMILRGQGMSAMADLRGEMGQLRNPLSLMAGRAMRVLAAGLLIIPGFLTDLVAIALLIPAVQRLIIATVAARVRMPEAPFEAPQGRSARGDITVIDGEFFEIDPNQTPPSRPRPSGWTQH